ncbi:hypothetical protein Ddc_21522 [Ditylenchus destructor]|nr:hypothetical protein Ddc_21522 [Ditylenchus destructor]
MRVIEGQHVGGVVLGAVLAVERLPSSASTMRTVISPGSSSAARNPADHLVARQQRLVTRIRELQREAQFRTAHRAAPLRGATFLASTFLAAAFLATGGLATASSRRASWSRGSLRLGVFAAGFFAAGLATTFVAGFFAAGFTAGRFTTGVVAGAIGPLVEAHGLLAQQHRAQPALLALLGEVGLAFLQLARFGLGLRLRPLFIGVDDARHQRVADHVGAGEARDRDAVDALQHLLRVDQPAGHAARQVDLAGVAPSPRTCCRSRGGSGTSSSARWWCSVLRPGSRTHR